jgi:TATA-binding protein-associated factor
LIGSGADVVIFLEHDWNPHADLQAMDRAHRIGQTRAVNVYRLVASNSIEEKVMKLQETKLATAAAIVNTDNSTMYTMGTDRLLDIFTFRSNDESSKGNLNIETLEAFVDRFQEDYASLSMETFLEGLGISTTLMSTLD